MAPPVISSDATWMQRSVGVLLLAAAALKLHGLGLEPVSAMGYFSAVWFQVALIEGEVLLGGWLIWGIAPVGAWATAGAVFIGFATVSLYQAAVGRATCGCFGRLALSPWVALGVDMLVLIALGLGRPGLQRLWRHPRAALFAPLVSAGGWLAGSALAFAALMALVAFPFGSLDAALAHYRGERIAIRPRLVDVGTAPLGERRAIEIIVTNYTTNAVRLIGGTSDCSCVITRDLPLTIPAGAC